MTWDTDKAIRHTRNTAILELWAHGKGYFIVRGDNQRYSCCQIRIYGYDRATNHRDCTATDYTLFVNGEWIEDGEHEVWQEIADKAEELGLRTGRLWDDVNHVETL